MSNAKIVLRALPNVEFVHGFPGIPAGPDRPQATIRGAIEVRLSSQAVKPKWVKVDLRKIETIPGGNHGEEFMDFIGQSPITVWQAQEEHETFTSQDFPFNIRVPETIPPSVALERGAGIKYEIVATLCTKGKKGLLRREASSTIFHSVPVVIDKHELHSTWPIYAQPESRHVVSDGLTLTVDRANTCFAPADRLSIMATLKSDNLSPVVLRGFEFILRETVIYRAGPHTHGKKSGPQVHTIILAEQKVPVSMTLYGGTQHKAELGCVVPGNHTTSSISAGRHIDIGYTLNIKALLDMTKPLTMDLPVTITNWPRHVSADMIRRIGTAPNLSLKPVPKSPMPVVSQTLESRAGQHYGPPRPPPQGGLPSLPNGVGGHHSVPPGALVSSPPGSPTLAKVANTMNPYSFQQNPHSMSGQVLQQTPSTVLDETSQRPGATPRKAINERAALAGGSNITASNISGTPDEFGYNRQSGVASSTVPSRQNEKHDFGVIDVSQRPASVGNHRPLARESSSSDFDGGSSNRASQYSQDSEARGTVILSPTSSSGRRARAMSRPLKIMNANDDIPEEESPVKKDAPPNPFDDAPQHQQPAELTTFPRDSPASSATHWPTADEEKHQLYETAKAKAEKVQAMARTAADGSIQTHSPRPSNGHASPPRQASPTSVDQANNGERPRTTSPTQHRTPWPTAEEEKQKLFDKAQAKARQTQNLTRTPGPATSSSTRPGHARTASANSSQDSHANSILGAYTTASPPTMSAGAALYSHAMSSLHRPASSVVAITPPLHRPAAPRRTTSHTGSGSTESGSGTPPTKQYVSAEGEKAALRYLEAKRAVDRRQIEEGGVSESIPQEAPIAYDALFPPSSSSAVPASGSGGDSASPQLSEKETLRRTYESRDTTVNQPAAATPPAASTQRSSSVRAAASPTSPSTPLSEKEVLRRAFEARDAAIIRSGQTPPPLMPPVQPPPSTHPPWAGSPPPSDVETRQKNPLSEKERMRLAFEARDRALAAQQALSPPDYDVPPPSPGPPPLGPPAPGPPPPAWNALGGTPLTAAEEKAQLKARYAAEEAGSGAQLTSAAGRPMTPQPREVERPGSPTRQRSLKSDTSETYLRRDPTISAGKKRASQMITPPPPSPPPPPPPLPPRPPAEYIEETKLVDRRNTLKAMMLPPSDFTSSFDLGFGSFDGETGGNLASHTS